MNPSPPPVRLSLAMIVKNESRCLARALSSARPFVDEMVVVDTGSSDNTIEIARDLGAQVHHFKWRDDFALARNAALSHTSGQWCLILDADEWVEGDPKAFRAFIQNATPDFLGTVDVVSQVDLNNQAAQVSARLPRLLPQGLRYKGSIHEQVDTTLPRQPIPLKLHHDGYLNTHLVAKQGRNEKLLLQALKKNPGHVYYQYQLAREYAARKDFAKALPFIERTYRQTDLRTSIRFGIVINYIQTLRNLERFEEAMSVVEAEMPHWPEHAEFYFALADLFMTMAQKFPEKAMTEMLPAAEQAFLRCLSIGEDSKGLSQLKGAGSYLAARNLSHIYRVAYGQQDKANEFAALADRLEQLIKHSSENQ